MEKILELYNRYRDYILFFIVIIVLVISEAFLFLYFSDSFNDIKKSLEDKKEVAFEEKTAEKKEFTVDIKGEVKKPGVYILEEGKRVIDVVKKAGGFTVYADSSANNLSMKIKDEMVIVIYSESEISDYLSTLNKEKQINEMCTFDKSSNDSCVSDESKVSNGSESVKSESSSSSSTGEGDKLVSLNTATIDELMTLPGIGESKAEAIIEYRKEKKFEVIEDVKNVSGIGDSLFEKIKDYITT